MPCRHLCCPLPCSSLIQLRIHLSLYFWSTFSRWSHPSGHQRNTHTQTHSDSRVNFISFFPPFLCSPSLSLRPFILYYSCLDPLALDKHHLSRQADVCTSNSNRKVKLGMKNSILCGRSGVCVCVCMWRWWPGGELLRLLCHDLINLPVSPNLTPDRRKHTGSRIRVVSGSVSTHMY